MKRVLVSLAIALGIIATPFTAFASEEQAVSVATVTPSSQAIALVNAEREAEGLPALAEDKELTAVAYVRSGEMDAAFSHTRPDGSQWYTAFDAVDAKRFTTVSIGENLAKGYGTAESVVKAWMNSPEHKANILRADYQYIGMVCVVCNGVVYWTCEFAG